MFANLSKRRRSDRADSAIVTFVIVFPLFFSFLITMIDTSVYFANRSIIQQIGRDGARTIAIYGGNGNSTFQSPLEARYGQAMACSDATALAKMVNDTSVECNLWRRLADGSGLTSVEFPNNSISCGPVKANTVGQTTFCEVQWNYNGVPGAVTNFISSGDTRTGTNTSLFYSNRTRVTSESEVGLTGICFVQRGNSTIQNCAL